MENIKLTFDDKSLVAIANKAIARKTGARGLRSIMENLLLHTMFDLPDMEDVEEVIIKEETVDKDKDPVLVRIDKKKKSSKKSDKDSSSDKSEKSGKSDDDDGGGDDDKKQEKASAT